MTDANITNTIPYFPKTKDQGDLFTNPKKAVQKLTEIYDANTAFIAHHYRSFCEGSAVPEKVHACYPEIRVTADKSLRINPAISYGFVDSTGTYSTTVTMIIMYAQISGDIDRKRTDHFIDMAEHRKIFNL